MSYPLTTAPNRDSRHWRIQQIDGWAALVEWLDLDNPADRKEAGGYLLGELRPTTVVHGKSKESCTNLHRRKDAVVSRWCLALDADYCTPSFASNTELVLPYAALLHPTWSYSPDEPRYRLLIPLSRPVLPDEYIACAEAVMAQLGVSNFDPSTAQPERYMFRPSAQHPSWYHYVLLDGPPADVDGLLAAWDPNLSARPMPAPHKNKRDPYTLEGVIGAFNRAYEDWDSLITAYELPYAKAGDDRYQLVGSAAEAGMGPIAGTGFVYSHHANDPAFGETCSAFDLVRLHRFGALDEDVKPATPINKRPSHTAMIELATSDNRVMEDMIREDFSAIVEEDDWKLRLARYKQGPNAGKPRDTIRNWDLLRKHDGVFNSLCYNELSLSPEFTADVPWRKVTPSSRIITENDRWEFLHYLDRNYGLSTTKGYADSHLNAASWQRVVNPVRDWLDGLVWDRTPRLETCLPGVRVSPYTRLVARKVMTAAVARMFEPGCKWDHVPVLVGDEGLGKTWWVEKVFRGFAAALGRIDNKDTLLICQRSWCVTADENHSMRKADQDAQKEFVTRTSDMFRMPYDRETLIHPRHWVVWATTNDRTFLTRQQGNRRYLIVECETSVDFDAMTDEYVTQLWAEAVFTYRAGERLFLTKPEEALAAQHREPFVEEDTLTGVILNYLNTAVPDDWWDREPAQRQEWLYERDAGFTAAGTQLVDRTCSLQIWVEALGRRKGDASRVDLLDLTNTLKRLPGWRAVGNGVLPGYGSQLIFVRDNLL